MNEDNGATAVKQVVAIGASAGGVSALQSMLPDLPLGQSTAYVLAMHMDPSHPSILDRILQRSTTLTVKIAGDHEQLLPDYFYVIPADSEGTIENGMIHLDTTHSSRGARHTVDLLFLSVAKVYGAHSVCVLLSGSGNDGLQGTRAIKAEQGVAIAQDPDSAEYTGMPAAIIQERLADVVTKPERIGEELTNILQWPEKTSRPAISDNDTFQALVRLLVRKTGVAFDQYKETTLQRRIERRRIVTRQTELEAYLQYVEKSELEAELLMKDMLISVTDFFRDKEVFQAIEYAIKVIVARKEPGESLRVWIPGCATGEEAFSIAMLIAEELEHRRADLQVQIFASDIDERAISVARKSEYLATQTRDVPKRLKDKYFVANDGIRRINTTLRDMVTFARHDLMQDPPFNRVDLVSCRNVLIYFKRATQERLINTFHYVLNPEGYLVLGPSESTGKLAELFEPTDQHAKIFVRRNLEAVAPTVLLRTNQGLPSPADVSDSITVSGGIEQRIQRLLFDKYAPPSMLVDQRFNLLHSHGDIGAYIKLREGEISVNVLDMATVGLRVELRLILQKSERENQVVRSHPIAVEGNSGNEVLTMIAIPAATDRENTRQTLVLFESRLQAEQTIKSEPNENIAFRVRELEQELSATRDHLQSNIEELEASNEELQSVNEEYQSTTEELQSTNEELQTANEELQSTNEELNTVNEELQLRSDELNRANQDIESILNTAVSGIVVLDNELRVTRYSTASREIFDLLPSSIGRPIVTVGGAVDLSLLSNEIQQAVASGSTLERELELKDKLYVVRLIPLSEDGESKGLIITFVDATESLIAARETQRLAAILKDSDDAITIQAPDGSILAWNRGAEKVYGFTEDEALAMNVSEITPPAARKHWRTVVDRVYRGDLIDESIVVRRHKDGHLLEVSIAITALVDEYDKPYALATTERDLSPVRQADARRQAESSHDARLRTAGEMAAGLAHELNQPITSIVHFCDVALSIAKQFDDTRRVELVDVLTDATQQSQRAGKIIRNLRRFLERRETVHTPHHINDIITDTAALMRTDCEQHGIELKLLLGDGLPRVSVDQIQISQVLVNLIKNSIEAIAEANKELRVITISSYRNSDGEPGVHVTVHDTGPGIDQENTHGLFEPFASGKENGLGMGLWICLSIVESSGGRLWLDEESSDGASFHFSLPEATEGIST